MSRLHTSVLLSRIPVPYIQATFFRILTRQTPYIPTRIGIPNIWRTGIFLILSFSILNKTCPHRLIVRNTAFTPMISSHTFRMPFAAYGRKTSTKEILRTVEFLATLSRRILLNITRRIGTFSRTETKLTPTPTIKLSMSRTLIIRALSFIRQFFKFLMKIFPPMSVRTCLSLFLYPIMTPMV